MLLRIRSWSFATVLFVGWLALAGPVRAQLEPAASDAVACLTPAATDRNRLDYPPEALRAGVAGATGVEMEFTSPTDPPKVTVVRTSDPSLDRVVVEHVSRYRVPCLVPGQRARLQQEFSFVPNPAGIVAASHAIDLRPADIPNCIAYTGAHSQPDFPLRGRNQPRLPELGVVLAQLRFTSADGPPVVTFPDGMKDSPFRQPVEEWVRHYRFTCYGGQPFEAFQLFRFVMHDHPQMLLADMTLLEFLGNVKLTDQKQYFELDRMSCPFTVQFQYLQPFMPNGVRETGRHVVARRAFLDWLSTLRLDVDQQSENVVLGESMKIAVPCGKVAL